MKPYVRTNKDIKEDRVTRLIFDYNKNILLMIYEQYTVSIPMSEIVKVFWDNCDWHIIFKPIESKGA